MHISSNLIASLLLLLSASKSINAAALTVRDTAASTEPYELESRATKYTFGGWCTFHVSWTLGGCSGNCNPPYDITFQPFDAKKKKLPVSNGKQSWPGTGSLDCASITKPFTFDSSALPQSWEIQPLSECSTAINFTYAGLKFQSPRPNDCDLNKKAVNGPQQTEVSCYSSYDGGFSLNGGWTC